MDRGRTIHADADMDAVLCAPRRRRAFRFRVCLLIRISPCPFALQASFHRISALEEPNSGPAAQFDAASARNTRVGK
jgi:hypothetical protein